MIRSRPHSHANTSRINPADRVAVDSVESPPHHNPSPSCRRRNCPRNRPNRWMSRLIIICHRGSRRCRPRPSLIFESLLRLIILKSKSILSVKQLRYIVHETTLCYFEYHWVHCVTSPVFSHSLSILLINTVHIPINQTKPLVISINQRKIRIKV